MESKGEIELHTLKENVEHVYPGTLLVGRSLHEYKTREGQISDGGKMLLHWSTTINGVKHSTYTRAQNQIITTLFKLSH